MLLTRLELDKKSVAPLILMFMNLVSASDFILPAQENLEIMPDMMLILI